MNISEYVKESIAEAKGELVNFDNYWVMKDFEEFVNELKAQNVYEFTISDKSTALMEILHQLYKNGVMVSGLVELDKGKRLTEVKVNGKSELRLMPYRVPAILMKIIRG